MIQRGHVVSQTGICYGTVVIPLGRVVANAGKHIQSLFKMTALNIIPRCIHMHGIFIISRVGLGSSVALSAKTKPSEKVSEISKAAEILISASISAAIRTASIGAASGCSPLPFVHDLLVRLLNLFEFFLRLILIRIVHVRVRMVFPAQRTVSFLDFLVRCVPRHTEHLIWVTHFPAVPFFGHVRFQTGTIRRNKGYCAECPYFPESGAFQKLWSIQPSSF